MIYENYFQVPDGALCKPAGFEKRCFAPKESWKNGNAEQEVRAILGAWEAQEKSITISEREFDEAFKRTPSPIDGNGSFYDNFKKELFK